MAEILTKALSFVMIIFMGNALRRTGFFKEEDFYVLSKIVLKITLPAAIISNFSGTTLKPSMLVITLMGLGGGILLILVTYLLTAKKDRKERAFHVLNVAGYNIGNFTMPFAQSFLGSTGVIVTSLFDTGNSFICLGGSYSIASMIQDKNGKFSITRILKTLVKSIPFDTYLIMTVLTLCQITLPKPVVSLANIIGGSNAFLAMLMMGVGLKLSGEKSQRKSIIRILSIRYSISIALALVFYFLLPFPLEYRQALTILSLSPIASAAPAFTADLKGDIGLASAVNSLSIVISIFLITMALLLIL
ncbi:MAG: AEC family transporter [Fusicatenibacter sp.]|nr:AEC family transporter [Fusicatenibacter sp.]